MVSPQSTLSTCVTFRWVMTGLPRFKVLGEHSGMFMCVDTGLGLEPTTTLPRVTCRSTELTVLWFLYPVGKGKRKSHDVVKFIMKFVRIEPTQPCAPLVVVPLTMSSSDITIHDSGNIPIMYVPISSPTHHSHPLFCFQTQVLDSSSLASQPHPILINHSISVPHGGYNAVPGVLVRKSGCLEPDFFTQELAADIMKAFSEVS